MQTEFCTSGAMGTEGGLATTGSSASKFTRAGGEDIGRGGPLPDLGWLLEPQALDAELGG